MKTLDDLREAFAGESQASRKYNAFAQKAEQEGFSQIAKLFRAAALAETIHASNHLRVMGGLNTTSENLKAAISGENYEVTTMYPGFIMDAEKESDKKALQTFKWAYEVEKLHEELYKKALANIGQPGNDLAYYVCPVCGYTHEGTPPDRCPICNTPSERFEKFA